MVVAGTSRTYQTDARLSARGKLAEFSFPAKKGKSREMEVKRNGKAPIPVSGLLFLRSSIGAWRPFHAPIGAGSKRSSSQRMIWCLQHRFEVFGRQHVGQHLEACEHGRAMVHHATP